MPAPPAPVLPLEPETVSVVYSLVEGVSMTAEPQAATIASVHHSAHRIPRGAFFLESGLRRAGALIGALLEQSEEKLHRDARGRTLRGA